MEIQIKRRNAIGMFAVTGRPSPGAKTIDLMAGKDKAQLEAIAEKAGWVIVSKWS